MTPPKKVRVSDAKVLEAKNNFRGPKKTLLAGLALMDSEPHSRLLHIEFSHSAQQKVLLLCFAF